MTDLTNEQKLIAYQAAQVKALELQCKALRAELNLANAERWSWPDIGRQRQELNEAREKYDEAVLEVYAAKEAMR